MTKIPIFFHQKINKYVGLIWTQNAFKNGEKLLLIKDSKTPVTTNRSMMH